MLSHASVRSHCHFRCACVCFTHLETRRATAIRNGKCMSGRTFPIIHCTLQTDTAASNAFRRYIYKCAILWCMWSNSQLRHSPTLQLHARTHKFIVLLNPTIVTNIKTSKKDENRHRDDIVDGFGGCCARKSYCQPWAAKTTAKG